MIYYAISVFVGMAVGFFLPAGFMPRTKTFLFNISLVGLLFFMGVNLGKDPNITSKLFEFGKISFIISILVIIFSVIGVLILVKLTGGDEK